MLSKFALLLSTTQEQIGDQLFEIDSLANEYSCLNSLLGSFDSIDPKQLNEEQLIKAATGVVAQSHF